MKNKLQKSETGRKVIHYKCTENDNEIKVIKEDGIIDELRFRSIIDKGWICIGIKDLNKALKIK